MKILKLKVSRDNLVANGGLEALLRATTHIPPLAEVISMELDIPESITVTVKIKQEGGGKVYNLA